LARYLRTSPNYVDVSSEDYCGCNGRGGERLEQELTLFQPLLMLGLPLEPAVPASHTLRLRKHDDLWARVVWRPHWYEHFPTCHLSTSRVICWLLISCKCAIPSKAGPGTIILKDPERYCSDDHPDFIAWLLVITDNGRTKPCLSQLLNGGSTSVSRQSTSTLQIMDRFKKLRLRSRSPSPIRSQQRYCECDIPTSDSYKKALIFLSQVKVRRQVSYIMSLKVSRLPPCMSFVSFYRPQNGDL